MNPSNSLHNTPVFCAFNEAALMRVMRRLQGHCVMTRSHAGFQVVLLPK
jgi:hypothetical protein